MDAHNITGDVTLPEERLQPHDAASLDLLVKSLSDSSDCNPVLSYKRQGEADEAAGETPLNEEDVFLVIMTRYQRTVYSDFGSDNICVDAPNGYDLRLITLLVVDEYASGHPVAFCISNRKDAAVYRRFFQSVKRVNSMDTNLLMSDDDPAVYNAWVDVMGPVTHHLLYSWLVDKNWQSNVQSKIKCHKKGVWANKVLHALQQECDEAAFTQKLQLFLQDLDADDETQEFARYFRSFYEKRAECWAHCYRKGLGINTNMYLEAFHKVLKHISLEREKTKRLDACVAALLKYARNKMFERLIKKEKNVPTYQMLAIQRSHRNSLSIKADMVAVLTDNEVFEVQASHCKRTYLVTKQENTCSLENICPLTCLPCKICVHAYSCTCVDSLIKVNICKHIHAVVRLCPAEEHYEISSPHAEYTEADDLMEETCTLKGPHDPVVESEKQLLINDVNVLEGCFRFQEMSTDNIKAAQKDLRVLLAKYNNDPLPLKMNNRKAANQKMEQQRALLSTIKRNIKTWTKPTANEAKNFWDNLGKGEAENIHTGFDHTYCK